MAHGSRLAADGSGLMAKKGAWGWDWDPKDPHLDQDPAARTSLGHILLDVLDF